MREWSRRSAAAGLAGVALSTIAPAAFAADCDAVFPSVPADHQIYGAGGGAETQTIAAVAAHLAGLPDPIIVFWHDPGACAGYQAYLENSITSAAVKYWSSSGTQGVCNAIAHAADFAHMGNDHELCVENGLVPPANWPEADGSFRYGSALAPVQTLNIIVDKDSSQESISAEALYYILGFGAGAPGRSVAPWTNPAHIVTRDPTSFAGQFLAQSIFHDGTQAIYDDPGRNGDNGRLGFRAESDVIFRVDAFGAVNAESPLGYVSGSELLADARSPAGRKTKVLAYQHQHQTAGYWPDLTESSREKLNVRTGKYHFWAPGHVFAHVVPNGSAFSNDSVATFIDAFVGSDDLDVLDLVVDHGEIPLCAMQVSREGLDGPISSFAPVDPCGCYFESRVTGTVRCDSCRDAHDEDCSEPGAVCRRGYCESY